MLKLDHEKNKPTALCAARAEDAFLAEQATRPQDSVKTLFPIMAARDEDGKVIGDTVSSCPVLENILSVSGRA